MEREKKITETMKEWEFAVVVILVVVIVFYRRIFFSSKNIFSSREKSPDFRFVFYQFESPVSKRQMEKTTTTATHPQIYISHFFFVIGWVCAYEFNWMPHFSVFCLLLFLVGQSNFPPKCNMLYVIFCALFQI